MSNAIETAIEKAKATAANMAAPTAVAEATNTAAVATQAMPARGVPMTMDDLMIGSMQVDAWLKVKEFGLLIGGAMKLFPNILVEINTKDVVPNNAIKFGNPAQYFKTYDMALCATGGTWAEAVRKAQMADQKARPYKSVDLPMVASEDYKDDKGNVLISAGQVLGHSTSTTNWGNWASFWKSVQAAGLVGEVVKVKLGFEPKKNPAGNSWGVVTFELLGAATKQ